MKEKLIAELMKVWESSYRNKNSKWYNLDRLDYLDNIKRLSIDDLQKRLNNLTALNSKSFEKKVNAEINKMDKAGLFNIGGLSPIHQLDWEIEMKKIYIKNSKKWNNNRPVYLIRKNGVWSSVAGFNRGKGFQEYKTISALLNDPIKPIPQEAKEQIKNIVKFN